MSRAFEARYHGRCANCEQQINPGDQVVYEDDMLEHAACAAETLPEIVVACPSCNLVHAGECW